MSATVLVIGPGTVSGPNPVPTEIVSAAIDAIDDEYVLVGERPVALDELWTRLIAAAAGEPADGLLLVCPGWWSEARVNRIGRAAGADARQRLAAGRDLGSRPAPVVLRRRPTRRGRR